MQQGMSFDRIYLFKTSIETVSLMNLELYLFSISLFCPSNHTMPGMTNATLKFAKNKNVQPTLKNGVDSDGGKNKREDTRDYGRLR